MSVSFGKKGGGGSKSGFGGIPQTPAWDRAPARQSKKERAARNAVFRSATVVFDSGERMQVAIKDLSATGARIEFLVRQALPAEFMLVEPMLKLRTRARVVWQDDNIAGLEFVAG